MLETKLAVIGVSGVGKSALVVRFLTRRFIWEYDPTLEWSYKYQSYVDDEFINMEILDTAGQADPLAVEGYARWADAFLFIYSIDDRPSFDGVASLFHQVATARRYCGPQASPILPPCVLVANKSDLVEEGRRVTEAEGERLAAEWGAPFFECSAAEGGAEVYEVFWEAHREAGRRRMLSNRRRRSSAQHVMHVFNKMLTKINNG